VDASLHQPGSCLAFVVTFDSFIAPCLACFAVAIVVAAIANFTAAVVSFGNCLFDLACYSF